MTDIEQAPIFFPRLIIFLEWRGLNHMSLHIAVWEVSVMSPTIREMMVLLGLCGAWCKGIWKLLGWAGVGVHQKGALGVAVGTASPEPVLGNKEDGAKSASFPPFCFSIECFLKGKKKKEKKREKKKSRVSASS